MKKKNLKSMKLALLIPISVIFLLPATAFAEQNCMADNQTLNITDNVDVNGETYIFNTYENCTHGCDSTLNRCRDAPIMEWGIIIGVVIGVIALLTLFYKKVIR